MNFFSIVDYEIIFNHVGSIAFTFDNTTSTVLPSSLNNLIAHDWPKINNLTNYITIYDGTFRTQFSFPRSFSYCG